MYGDCDNDDMYMYKFLAGVLALFVGLVCCCCWCCKKACCKKTAAELRESMQMQLQYGASAEFEMPTTENPMRDGGKAEGEAGEHPLPAGWEACKMEDGTPYYVDNNTGTTQWTPPGAVYK